MNSVQQVVEQALCSACGACSGICVAGAIRMEENPGGYLIASVDCSKCVDCGQCLKVCPSVPENQRIEDLDKSLHGICLEGFIGYASEKSVRREGQSGGVVTALLLYLLESGKIDGAVTNQFDPEKRRSKAVYVNSRRGLMESCGSYYTQSSVVKTIIEHSDKRLAAVVLGCQAEALALCKTARPEYLLGLICAGQNSGHMIDRLISKTGCTSNETAKKFRFRYSHPAYGSWPGNILIVTDQHRYVLDKSERFALKTTCEAYRCLLCYDQMCTRADIVFGDPWGIEGDHSAGETVMIARTEKGLQLIRDAVLAGYLVVEPLAVEKIMQGETVDTRHREKVAVAYSVCDISKWNYPYSVSPDIRQNFLHVSTKAKRQYLSRLRYTRARCLAKTAAEVTCLEKAYLKKNRQMTQHQKWTATVKLPLRCARFVLRNLTKG